jgi:hypothetical protein
MRQLPDKVQQMIEEVDTRKDIPEYAQQMLLKAIELRQLGESDTKIEEQLAGFQASVVWADNDWIRAYAGARGVEIEDRGLLDKEAIEGIMWRLGTSKETDRAFYSDGQAAMMASAMIGQAAQTYLSPYTYEIEETVLRQVDIPLCRIHAPGVDRASVAYQQEVTEEQTTAWKLTVFGTGLGADQTFSVGYKDTLKVGSGDYKQLVVPLMLQVSRVAVYEGRKHIKVILRVEPAPADQVTYFSTAPISLTQADLANDLAHATRVEEVIPYARDLSREVHEVERSVTATKKFTLTVGVDAFDLKATCDATIKRERKVVLKCELPAGHDYRRKRLRDLPGYVWQVD